MTDDSLSDMMSLSQSMPHSMPCMPCMLTHIDSDNSVEERGMLEHRSRHIKHLCIGWSCGASGANARPT